MATEAPTAGVMVGGPGVAVRAVTVRATGYGAMQLAGDGVFGPPRDRGEAALAAARELESKGFKPYIARGDQ